jgi:hypothetical protein
VSSGVTDLRNCSLLCRVLWELAAAELYKHVHLKITEAGLGDRNTVAKNARRQLQLLRAISGYVELSDVSTPN